MKHGLAVAVLVAATTNTVSANDGAAATPDEQLEIARRLAPSLVRVELTPRYDGAEAPQIAGLAQRCPNCGSFHVWDGGAELVLDEKPAAFGGYLIDATHVVIPDPAIQPRFIKDIQVAFKEETVAARVSAVARDQRAVMLELASPLKEAQPLRFESGRPAPYLAVTYGRANGRWTTTVQVIPARVVATGRGGAFTALPSASLIVDSSGGAVGLSMNDRLDLNGGWKGSPTGWAVYTTEHLRTWYAEIEKRAGLLLPRVHLSFRSPKRRSGQDEYTYRGSYGWDPDGDDPDALERDVVGIFVDSEHVLVLANLSPEVTARLEHISIHAVDAGPIPARFIGSLRNFGCFVAGPERLPEPATEGLAISDADLGSLDQTCLPTIDLRLHGEQRVSHVWHERLTGIDVGWKGRPYPALAGDASNRFMFDAKGALLAFPISRRTAVRDEEAWRADEALMTPARYVTEALGDLSKHIDPSNIPLAAEDENRLGWLGVELQGLSCELARANGVADLTTDGTVGALVSYVHADSPAEACGIEQGDILLRLHLDDRQAPIPVKLSEYAQMMTTPFPWEQLDQIPLEYFEQVPQPWPSARNAFRQALTKLGFGKEYVIELSRGGEVLRKRTSVDRSPPDFDAGRQFKSERLGLTVRDLTFDVRLYFQKRTDDPGVIVSRVEPGGKGAVAGIRPFEIITHVNDTPVSGTAEFEALVAGQGELRVSVDRKGRGRLARISGLGADGQ